MSLSLTALDFARLEVGVHEVGGNNRGPRVEQYLAAAGGEPGDPWCESFIYWLFEQASRKLGLRNPVPRTPSTQAAAQRSEPYCRTSNPTPGAVGILSHGGSKGHAVICESVDADFVPTCISGNTFDDARGGREGNCVARHVGFPEVVHGGTLLGWWNFDLAAQSPDVT